MASASLTRGPVFKTLLVYSIPLVVTNVVQLLFHATDVAVLGAMVDDYAVAAVGACGSLITLLVSLFTGFATGANVIVAKREGARDASGVKRAIGTSLVIGFVSGVILMIIALIGARQFLIWMNCRPEVLDMATLYMRIYFIGMPIWMLYNFVSAILRALGDSMRPMIYMLVSGVLNVLLNILFIGALGMTVDGVAIATVVSSLVSLILAIIALIRSNDGYKIKLKDLKIGGAELSEIVKIGVPTCFCGIFFYVANVIISSAVNSISTDSMTANTISGQIDGVVYNVGFSIAIACAAMVGQCLGAADVDRIRQTMRVSALYVSVASLSVGAILTLASRPLLSLMTDSESVIVIAQERLALLCLTYFITSVMEVFSFSLRALGKQTSTMVVGGICGLAMRGSWVWLVWPLKKTLGNLFVCYPITAAIAVAIYVVVYINTMKELRVNISPAKINE